MYLDKVLCVLEVEIFHGNFPNCKKDMDISFVLVVVVATASVFCCLAITEQDAINAIAAKIGSGCMAPSLESCAGTCTGINCTGTFNVTVDGSKNIVKLFVRIAQWLDRIISLYILYMKSNKIQSIPTEISALSKVTYLDICGQLEKWFLWTYRAFTAMDYQKSQHRLRYSQHLKYLNNPSHKVCGILCVDYFEF